MPIYEYRCKECDESFEVFVRSSSQKIDLTRPNCGSQKVKKSVTLFGVGGTVGGNTSAASCAPSSST